MAYDNLDAKLINALQSDGRASLRSLAEDLDVSVTTISNHLDELTETGKIEGFTPVIDYEGFGYDVTAVMQFSVDGESIRDVTDHLEEYDQMVTVYETTGDHDVVAIGKFEDTDDMNDAIKGLLDNPGIEDTNTSVVLNDVKDNDQFGIPVTEE